MDSDERHEDYEMWTCMECGYNEEDYWEVCPDCGYCEQCGNVDRNHYAGCTDDGS